MPGSSGYPPEKIELSGEESSSMTFLMVEVVGLTQSHYLKLILTILLTTLSTYVFWKTKSLVVSVSRALLEGIEYVWYDKLFERGDLRYLI